MISYIMKKNVGRMYTNVQCNNSLKVIIKSITPTWPPFPAMLYYNFIYSVNFRNGQNIHLDHQPAHLSIFLYGFPYFLKISVVGGKYLIFTSVADSLISLLVSCVAEDVVLLALHLGKVKFGSRHPLVDVLDVVAGGLEVGGSVVGTGHEDLRQQ